ncbi:hypothetical protein [Curtobacterium sp. MCLR17_034]|uniref:phage tail tube protein n=1 Tax=Curtobacterium sp. MCLR17_034 TaxID=2175623 RepID=UPI000DA98DD6|nr:hypothetical protein [Curtobacterium sp. MCLR17_034]PZF11765.1 hypothetical protein DEI98_06500 [Curtobacterium sp. MCLR17_034]
MINKGSQSLSVGTEGHLLVMAAPASILTAGKTLKDITVTQLNSAAFVDITYDLTAGSGWAETTSQERITDDRLTSKDTFSRGGKKSSELSIQYIYGDPTNVADPLFVEDENYVFAVRWATDHDADITSSGEFDLWLNQAGVKQRDQAAANSVFTKTQPFYPLAKVERDVTPATGS